MDYAMLDRCLHKSSYTQPLTVEEEKRLLQRFQTGDAVARHRLVESNIRFVVKLALKYRNQGLALADLIQEGILGLIEALEKFDTEKDCRLITYASWWIRLYIQRALEQKSRPVNLPINKLDMLRKVRAFEKTFEQQHGRKPFLDEVAVALDFDRDKIEELNDLAPVFNSIHGQDDDHPGLEKVLVDERAPEARDVIWLQEAQKRLDVAMRILNHREREVLSHRYGLQDGGKRLSLRKVGQRMGLSAEGVRRIEEQAMTKLRRPAIMNKIATLVA